MNPRAPFRRPEGRSALAGRTWHRAVHGRRRTILLAAWLAAAQHIAGSTACATAVLPPDPGLTVGRAIPFDGFVDDDGKTFEATDGDPRPWIVLPMYTHCPTTCSALTAGLRNALRDSGMTGNAYRVLLLSFDPHETDATLADFRRRMRLPDAWTMLRAREADALQRTVRALDFHTIQLDGGVFEHPNLLAVLDGRRRLVTYVFGVPPSSRELAAAVNRARDGVSALDGWRPFLFLFAALGLLASAAVYIGIHERARYRARAAACRRMRSEACAGARNVRAARRSASDLPPGGTEARAGPASGGSS